MIKKIAVLSMALCFSGVSYAADWTVSADLRERYQSFNNFDFNSTTVDAKNWEFDSRLYVKAKADFDHGISLYLQPQAVSIKDNNQANGTRNFTQADFIQAYAQYQINDVMLRLGRQQLVYGDQRLLGHLGWKDVARTFDGVKVAYKTDAVAIDVFAVHPADMTAMTPSNGVPQGKSLVTWEDRSLVGVYATYHVADKTGVDAYLINWSHNQNASVGKNRNINTFGTRLFANNHDIDLTAEAAFQKGDWSTGVSQSASAYAIKVGYMLDAWKTRFGIEYNYSPGDAAPGTGTHKDFVFPYHTNHGHYGEMDFFSWANMKDLRLSVKTSPAKGLSLLANMHFLYLDKATGDWVNVVGAGVVNGYTGKSTYTQTKAGTEIDLKVVYKPSMVKGLKLVGQYGLFNPGAAVSERNAGKADQATFSYLIAQYAF